MEVFGRQKDGFILDSALPANGLGRFSFAGADPFLVFRARGRHCELRHADGRVELLEEEPLALLRRLMSRHRCGPVPEGIPFGGGAVGCFSYEFGASLEQVPSREEEAGGGVPDICLGFYDAVLAVEVASGRAWLLTSGAGGRDPLALRQGLEERLRSPAPAVAAGFRAAEPVSDLGPGGFMAGVSRIRDYIAAGDVYQVNLAHRLETPWSGDPASLYLRLRGISPAPFGAYLNFGDMSVLSVSPERFLALRGRRVSTRPIKGTRPRGATPVEDRRLADELLASEKDRAELLMIVDLERNDLGRVCRIGSVRVDELHTLERHPTVWHLVSEVSGELAEGRDVFDLLRASFPGGSITGAPKIRAMQIIRELEPHARGVYTGAIGYFGFDGDAELNIAIRTLVCRDGRATYHVGGGITWGSDPSDEYAETLAKGRALREALLQLTDRRD